ncbi:MAG: hypothetical protein BroJett011_61020 [Chloroflexota bacterium]|nr:MAG: hypothetical protein BroJett011_61020 [Chloroflexota bacterium]
MDDMGPFERDLILRYIYYEILTDSQRTIFLYMVKEIEWLIIILVILVCLYFVILRHWKYWGLTSFLTNFQVNMITISFFAMVIISWHITPSTTYDYLTQFSTTTDVGFERLFLLMDLFLSPTSVIIYGGTIILGSSDLLHTKIVEQHRPKWGWGLGISGIVFALSYAIMPVYVLVDSLHVNFWNAFNLDLNGMVQFVGLRIVFFVCSFSLGYVWYDGDITPEPKVELKIKRRKQQKEFRELVKSIEWRKKWWARKFRQSTIPHPNYINTEIVWLVVAGIPMCSFMTGLLVLKPLFDWDFTASLTRGCFSITGLVVTIIGSLIFAKWVQTSLESWQENKALQMERYETRQNPKTFFPEIRLISQNERKREWVRDDQICLIHKYRGEVDLRERNLCKGKICPADRQIWVEIKCLPSSQILELAIMAGLIEPFD